MTPYLFFKLLSTLGGTGCMGSSFSVRFNGIHLDKTKCDILWHTELDSYFCIILIDSVCTFRFIYLLNYTLDKNETLFF
jgi:hypothetical protein